KIWSTSTLSNCGPMHLQLESEMAGHLGVPFISLFNNGTTALLVGLQVLDVSGEVITTPYSFVATAHSILWNGLTPVFADIGDKSLNLAPEAIEAAITPRSVAIMPVHCYGNPCNVQRIEAIAKRHGLKVIYDAAHAFGVQYRGQSVLRHGDVSVLSFHATKVFSTIEGGAIVSRDAASKARIDRLRNFGIAGDELVSEVGLNGKMNEVQAAFGLLQLRRIGEALRRRQEIDAIYRYHLSDVDGITCLPPAADTVSNFAYFPVFVGPKAAVDRDQIYTRMRERGIFARKYFYPLLSSFPMYRDLPSSAPDNLPNATRVAREVLCLPMHQNLSAADITAVVDAVRG
ncbi:MAG: DegT/DnrJ/EryC1/StrS family aminotransferase, partial [Woeseiaceae bacterium]